MLYIWIICIAKHDRVYRIKQDIAKYMQMGGVRQLTSNNKWKSAGHKPVRHPLSVQRPSAVDKFLKSREGSEPPSHPP